MIATFLAVEDRNRVFLPGEEYSADCISQWLQDDEVTLGAIFADGRGNYWKACDAETGTILRRCDRKGNVQPHGDAFPMLDPHEIDPSQLRWRTFLSLAHFDVNGAMPTIREIAIKAGVSARSIHGVEKQLKNLERLGLVYKEPYAARGVHLTEAGHKLLAAYRKLQ